MSPALEGAELRTFLPTRDFERSKAFYAALGFEQIADGEVAIFRCGAGAIILQRYYEEHWAGNMMMGLMVDDLDAWWRHIDRLGLAERFGVPEPKPPAVQPWGLRVAYVVDPAGVLWHFAERAEA
jgi:catechol 2,3-dioxygenase-like lactoylglutathione lyase family enzyme